jgi:ribokinase
MSEPEVVVVGSVNVDHIVVAEAFPAPGETVRGISVITAVGGKGANQAVAVAALGGPVRLVGQVGADDDGTFALEHLSRSGADLSGVAVVAGETGSAWITVAGGDNTIVVVPGANGRWPEQDERLGALEQAGVVLAQLEIPIEVVHRAAQACTSTFVLNAAPATVLPDELIARCGVLIVNETELAGLAGLDRAPTAHAEVVRAQQTLLDRGAGAVLATLGADGAILVTRERAVHQPALPTTVVDSTGAGDALCGAFAAALAAGVPLEAAVSSGVAAGSLAVRTSSAKVSFGPDDLAAALRALPVSVPV